MLQGTKLFKRDASGTISRSQGPADNRPVLAPVVLTGEQKAVLQAVLSGQNVFFTGSAGTGKSFLLRRIIGKCLYCLGIIK